jgi:hypothetical protein
VFDPIWTTANITAHHGAMIYDTLFGINEELEPRPQMVGDWIVSDDKLTYTFVLRDGLKFSDGSPVTADDVVASILRWAARDGAGQQIMDRARDISKKDHNTFVIALKEPYGPLIDMMAKTGMPMLFIMRRKEAETDPYQQVTEYIGSGPFIFNRDETRHGVRYVYDKSPTYVPRREPASGMAGGKVVKVDRVVFENIGDTHTAVAALQAGEIDFYETPPLDLIDQLEGESNLRVEVLNKTGNLGWLRMNCLHPPFDKVEARQAMLHLVDQEEYMKASFGNPKYYRAEPRQSQRTVSESRLRRPPCDHPPRHRCGVRRQRRPDHSTTPAADWRPRAARHVRLGRRCHPSRQQEPARPRRLEHLHHVGNWCPPRQSDRPRARRKRREGLVRLAAGRNPREAAREVGECRLAGGAEGNRARNATQCLELRPACLARPMGRPGCLPLELAWHTRHSNCHSFLERGKARVNILGTGPARRRAVTV